MYSSFEVRSQNKLSETLKMRPRFWAGAKRSVRKLSVDALYTLLVNTYTCPDKIFEILKWKLEQICTSYYNVASGTVNKATFGDLMLGKKLGTFVWH